MGTLDTGKRKRRGKKMTPEQRAAVSLRMRKHWADAKRAMKKAAQA